MADINTKFDENLAFRDLIGLADETFRRSLSAVNQWTEQLSDALENKPGAVLAGIAMAGFLAGAILRGKTVEKRRNSREFAKDSAFLFVAGTIAGIVAAPFFKNELDLHSFVTSTKSQDFGHY